MTENMQLTYLSQVKNTEEWLEALVTDIEGRISESKENELTVEGATEALTLASQSLSAIHGQRAALLDIRDNKLDVQSRRDDVTRVIQECRRAEDVIKHWATWLSFQDHRLSGLRDDNEEVSPE